MATTKKRSSTSAGVSKSALEQAGVMLQELPEKPKDNWSLREAVTLLQDSIFAALDRGYSYEEITKLLGNKGVEIAAPSLKRYLATVKREKGQTAKAKTRQNKGAKGNPAAVESAALASAASSLAAATPASASKKPSSKRQTKAAPTSAAKAKPAAKAEPKAAAKKAKAKPTARAKTTSRSTAT